MIVTNASFIILKNKNKFLLYLRDNIPSIIFPNHWSFIGGAIDKNESPIEALKREIKEEINYEVNNMEFFKSIIIKKHKIKDKEHTIYSFKNQSNKTITGDVKTIYENYDINRTLYFFKGNINKNIGKISLNEGQRLDYFTLKEIENLKIVPIIKKFILENKNLL
tara:strand:- start:421 stop:915 length:495 start_codon:yes stop_codon:yes gene_type:complete